ncbi:MAG: biosynthetic-type acetolactate synthase large subunit [Spirochaetia bacterium]|nr:biosynthetic-type acetolactate synthase large subunit [Spirochaetia bacterium]
MDKTEKQRRADEVEKTGSKILLDTILANGVEVCWGYPGGAILPFYDEIYHSSIKHILVRHEQGAAFAAEGYAKATGKLGVAISTSGPGATNLVTGIADAKMDSIPVLFVTGQVATKDIGTDAFQEADTYGMSIPITKYNALVKNVDDVARITREAITVAMSGRQGPVLIDFPKDIQAATSRILHAEDLHIPEIHYKKAGLIGEVKHLIEAINSSKKPVLYVGGGVISSDTYHLLGKLAGKTQAPVASTLMGLGAFPGQNDLFLGMLGMHGTAYANKAVMECDLIVALGARFDDRVALNAGEFASQAVRAQVDIDIAEIGKRVNVDIHIAGDLADIMQLLIDGVQEVKSRPWVQRIQELKEASPLKYNLVKNAIKPQHFIHRLSERTSGNAVIVTDVGQHQMWAAQFYAVNKPRNWITSGGLGSMGFGLPAAIGAKYGRPDDEVILLTGDGSIQMNIQELATVRMYNIPVKIILFHNGFLGMVRQWQSLFYGERFSSSKLHNNNPDFCKIAQAYGIAAKKISLPDEMEQGIDFILDSKDACLLEVMIPDYEHVYPMIASGHRYEDMIEFDSSSEEGELFSVIPHKKQQGKAK